MAYTLPQFNVNVDVWNAGHVPSEDDPDYENVTSQFYIYSRIAFDVQPCELELYQPSIQIRMPLAAVVAWTNGQVFEAPAESGRYYRARFKERVHLGFANEYLVIQVVQCGSDGIPILRDIEGAIACGGPTDALLAAGDIGEISAGYFTESADNARAILDDGSEEIIGAGDGSITATYTSEGQATLDAELLGGGEGSVSAGYSGSGQATLTP